MAEFLEYRVNGALAELCLNRPRKLNAINAHLREALAAAFERAAADDAVRVVLLHGNGRAFSAGFDLDMGEPAVGETRQAFLHRELRRDFEVIMKPHECPKPVVAAVHGYCLGSSMELAALCDLTIAAEGCRFGAPEARFASGMVCLILPWIVGQKHARDMLLTGRHDIDAQQAEAMGLVNRVVPQTELLGTARALATQIADNDPYAVQMTKRALNESLRAAGLYDALQAALSIDLEIESRGSVTDTG